MLNIYNTLTKQKAPLQPVQADQLRIYLCGMTVYDFCHIGHARSMIVFDVLTRFLRHQGLTVRFVNNITDIDDKIIRRAQERQQDWRALVDEFIQAMQEDKLALGILPPDEEPRATEYIDEIIALIERLIAAEKAYVSTHGDVCFDVRSYADYGKLSHRDVDQLLETARVEDVSGKRSPLDFVLWKQAKPGEPAWPSPWGEGRPGWHIECSAMSTALLGQPFDIHGGGMDLKFPHHENEIAQSEAACDHDFAKVWMHVGLLQVDGEKMSKSLNNFFTIRDVLKHYSAEVLRYFMLSGHYRSPVNYSTDTLKQSYQALARLYTALRDLPPVDAPAEHPLRDAFMAAMEDDLNTPQAFAVFFEMAHEIQRLRAAQPDAAAAIAALLRECAGIIGLLQTSPREFLHGNLSAAEVDKIERLIQQREVARADKQWAEADRLRDALTALGVELEDAKSGTLWRIDTALRV